MACALVVSLAVPCAGPIGEALDQVLVLCRQMRENETMCRRVHERMKSYLDELERLTDKDESMLRNNRVLVKYTKTVSEVIKFLQEHRGQSLLKRLVHQRKMVDKLQRFHEQLDELYKLLNIAHITEMRRWREQLQEDLRRQERLQEERTNELLARQVDMLHQQLRAEKQLPELLASLKFELLYKRDETSVAQQQLMEDILDAINNSALATVPDVPIWFISRDEISLDPESFSSGCYSFVYRGTWGKGTRVVVKCLNEPNASDAFFKEANVWYGLDHPHIIKMYGGCNVSSGLEHPAFFVCEDAINGSFIDYLEEDKSRIWRLFYDVALGLDYLHSHAKVVHGDLKCNNLLVGSDGKGKICDFGFAFVRAVSSKLSVKDQADNIRWKAPECLIPESEYGNNGEDEKPRDSDPRSFNPRFASDVFSLGMCIIEAFLGVPPYGYDVVDDDILDAIEAKTPYPREGILAEALQDDEWALVERMCVWNYKQRISLSAAIDDLKMFADREAETNARAQPTKTPKCAKCAKEISDTDCFCGGCASRESTRVAEVA